MFTVCHTEEAELLYLPPQLLPRCPVYDTILIWFLILFPVLSQTDDSDSEYADQQGDNKPLLTLLDKAKFLLVIFLARERSRYLVL